MNIRGVKSWQILWVKGRGLCSLFTVQRIEMDTSWFKDVVKDWPALADYRHVRDFARDHAVFNDGAERGTYWAPARAHRQDSR